MNDMQVERLAQWKGAIELELQDLVKTASDIREKINTAKTDYKKKYYNKKFQQVSSKVMQMVAALQRIQQHEAAKAQEKQETKNETPAPESTPTETP